jgi:prophage antirepressor-like protein
MESLVQAVHRFDEQPVTSLFYKGKPAWIAREIGVALGYSQGGKRLATRITGEWSKELILSQDYAVLTGTEAALLERALGKGTEAVPLGSNRGLVILYESGLYLVLAKTEKAAGVRFRRFLADEVLPQLTRTGSYSRSQPRQVTLPFVLVPVAPANRPMLTPREERLGAQRALQERKFRNQALRETVRLLHQHGELDQKTWLAWEVAATEIALGKELPGLRPQVDVWFSPTQIAGMARVSAQAVGRAITDLGLRGHPGLSRAVRTMLPDANRIVHSWVYTQAAVAQILDVLAGTEPPKAA